MKRLLLFSAVIFTVSCNGVTQPSGNVTSARLTSTDAKPTANINSVTYKVFKYGSNNCNIRNYLCGASVSVVSGGLVVSGLTVNPNGKVTLSYRNSVDNLSVSYKGVSLCFDKQVFNSETLLTVKGC